MSKTVNKHEETYTEITRMQYQATTFCKCGRRFVDWGDDRTEAIAKSRRALDSHILAPSVQTSDHGGA